MRRQGSLQYVHHTLEQVFDFEIINRMLGSMTINMLNYLSITSRFPVRPACYSFRPVVVIAFLGEFYHGNWGGYSQHSCEQNVS